MNNKTQKKTNRIKELSLKKVFLMPGEGKKIFEHLFLYFSFIFVAIFVHPKITYEFSTAKYLFTIIFFTLMICFFLYRKSLQTFSAGSVQKEREIFISWAQIGWFIFGVSAVISTISVLRTNPLYFPFSFEIGIYTFFTFFIVMYFSNSLESKRDIIYFLVAAIFAGFLVAIEALNNYYTGNSFFLGNYGEPGKMAMKATIGNPNFVSDFLGSLLPITVYFAVSSDLGWKLKKEESKLLYYLQIFSFKIIALVNFILFYLVVLFSGTRGVLLSLLIGFLVVLPLSALYYFLIKKRSKNKENQGEKKILEATKKKNSFDLLKTINFISIGVLVFAAVFLPVTLSNPDNSLAEGVNIAERTASIFDTRGFQITGGKHRIFAWLASVYQWKDNPVIGAGIGTYMLEVIDYMGEAIHDNPQYVDAWSNFKRTHNDYFQVLGEMGLFGIIALFGTLAVMILIFFKILKFQKFDDALLLILLAVAFTEILGHSATEFPLHLLPNQLWAIAIGGIAFGKYFNKSNFLAKRFNLSKKAILITIVAVVAVGVTAGVLKNNSVMAEVFFKEGNGYYGGLSQLESAQSQVQSKKTEADQLMKDLSEGTGQYVKFSPSIYYPKKIQEYKNTPYALLTQQELEAKILSDMEIEKAAELKKINSYIMEIDNQIEVYSARSIEYFNLAENLFLQSLQVQKCYGKSYFYLALLMTRPERKKILVNEFNNSSEKMDVLKRDFSEISNDTEFIDPKFRTFILKDDYEVLSGLFSEGFDLTRLINDFELSNWYDIKMYQDAVDYLETSFLSFNEKNSYRILGKFSYNIGIMLINQRSAYLKFSQSYPDFSGKILPLINIKNEQINSALQDFQSWYDKAIYILPANWNMFPDWEGIYLEYIDLLLKTNSVLEIYPKVKEVAEKRIWASKWMHNEKQMGVPDDIAAMYAQLANAFLKEKMYQETLYSLDDGLNILLEAYNWSKQDLVDNPYLSEEQKARIEKFIKGYEELLDKRKQFLEQVSAVYINAQKNGDFETLWLEDWKLNKFSGENWESANFSEILKIIENAQKVKFE